jgi:hypothetical protein
MVSVLLFLWTFLGGWSFLAGLAVGAILTGVVTFYLNDRMGTQISYVLRAIPHPLRLLHGQVLCPQCQGRPTDDGVCFVCLAENQLHNTPPNFVTLRFLMKRWNKRQWHQLQPIAYVPTVKKGRQMKVPIFRIPGRHRA